MTEFNSLSQEEDLEFVQNLTDLKNFAASFSAADFVLPNPKEANPRASQILEALPRKLQEYVQELRQMEEQVAKENAQETATEGTREEEEKKRKQRKERERRVEKLAQEIFIISCASNKPIDKNKKEFSDFLDKYNLGTKLNEFGENGLSPAAATMISGKSDLAKAADLEKLVEAGVNVSKKDLKNFDNQKSEIDSSKREQGGQVRQRGGREISSKKESQIVVDSKLEARDQAAQREADSQAREQSQIIEAGIALEFHQIAMLQILDSLKKQAAQNQKELVAKKESEQFQAKLLEESEKEKIQIIETAKEQPQAPKQDRSIEKTALEQILGISLNEKSLDSMLTYAVQNGQATLALLLVSFGANVNHKEYGVRTVVEIAAASGNNSLTTILSQRANPDTKNAVISANPGLREMIETASLDFKKLVKESQLITLQPTSFSSGQENPIITERSDLKKMIETVSKNSEEVVKESCFTSSSLVSKDLATLSERKNDSRGDIINEKPSSEKSDVVSLEESRKKKIQPEKPSPVFRPYSPAILTGETAAVSKATTKLDGSSFRSGGGRGG